MYAKKHQENTLYTVLFPFAMIAVVIAMAVVIMIASQTAGQGGDMAITRKWCSERDGDYWEGMTYYSINYAPSCIVPVKRGVFTIGQNDYVFEKEIMDYDTGLIMVFAKRRVGSMLDGTYYRESIDTYVTRKPDIEPHKFSN